MSDNFAFSNVSIYRSLYSVKIFVKSMSELISTQIKAYARYMQMFDTQFIIVLKIEFSVENGVTPFSHNLEYVKILQLLKILRIHAEYSIIIFIDIFKG